jgi:hypothetical protein
MIVDGHPFPWHVENHPVVRQLLPDLFEVRLTFYARQVDGVDVTQLPAAA